MKFTWLYIFLLITSFVVSQVKDPDPFSYLNLDNEPPIFNDSIISENGISQLLIQNCSADEYNSAERRVRVSQQIIFSESGQIISIYVVDSAQVFEKSKEDFWGKIRIQLGLKKNMIYQEKVEFFYNSEVRLDSSYSWFTNYLDDEYYHSERTLYDYDKEGRMVFQKTIKQEYWKANSKDNDTAAETYTIKYKDHSLEYDTLYVFKEDWGSADLYDTTIGEPKPQYHLGSFPPEIELGENGYLKRVTRSFTVYTSSGKRGGLPTGSEIRQEYVDYYYDTNGRLASKSYLNGQFSEKHQTQFTYDTNGLILKSEDFQNGIMTVLTKYNYSRDYLE